MDFAGLITYNSNQMKRYILIGIVLLFSFIPRPSSAGSVEDIRRKLKKEGTPEEKRGTLFNIQRMYKDKVTGWIWGEGQGTRSVLAITVKFRITMKGEDIKVPYLCVYLYDKGKNLIKKVNIFYYKDTIKRVEGSEHDTFRGNQTYVLQFPYKIEDKIRYAVAVVGNDQHCAAAVLPRTAGIDNFEFPEKNLAR